MRIAIAFCLGFAFNSLVNPLPVSQDLLNNSKQLVQITPIPPKALAVAGSSTTNVGKVKVSNKYITIN